MVALNEIMSPLLSEIGDYLYGCGFDIRSNVRSQRVGDPADAIVIEGRLTHAYLLRLVGETLAVSYFLGERPFGRQLVALSWTYYHAEDVVFYLSDPGVLESLVEYLSGGCWRTLVARWLVRVRNQVAWRLKCGYTKVRDFSVIELLRTAYTAVYNYVYGG